MITDENSYAGAVVDDYNMVYVPTCYFDQGVEVLVGGYPQTSYYSSRILSCGDEDVADLDLTVEISWLGNATVEVIVMVTNNQFVNSPPDTPTVPTKPDVGIAGTSYTFTSTGTDEDNHQIWYRWDFDDGTITDWMGPYASGEMGEATHAFTEGIYQVKVQTKDELDDSSPWRQAGPLYVDPRGDANNDGSINVGDGVFVINYVFKGGPAPDPTDRADANCDFNVNVGDGVFIINFVFKGGPEPGSNCVY